MSLQLILYPQKYEGSYSSTTTQQVNEYVADNVLFQGVAATSVHNTTSTNPTNHAVINNPATQSWKRFRTNGGSWGTPTQPTISGGALVLDSDTTISQSGVYQLITNLTIGQDYEIKVTISQAAAGANAFVFLHTTPHTWTDTSSTTRFTVGTSTQINLGSTGSTGTLTSSFTAQHTSEVLIVTYQNDSGAAIKISKVSIKENINTAPQVQGGFSDGQVICDLYDDSTIPLSLSVDNFKNAAEKIQSYSKSFNLPATKRNNKIFTHLFEVTTSQDAYSFNPYIKTQAILKEDSYSIFEGYLRLIEIINKSGEISYNVNLYSEAISLKDTLNARTFSDLDFTELEHDYHRTNIQGSWTNALPLRAALTDTYGGFAGTTGASTTGVLKYPFCDWTGTLELDNTTTPPTLELSSLQDAFRPWIQIKYLIDRIFYDAGFQYTSNFFNTDDFKRLFMDFNWGAENAPSESTGGIVLAEYKRHLAASNNTAGSSYTNLQLNAISFNNQGVYDTTNFKFVSPEDTTDFTIQTYSFRIEYSSSSTFTLRWVHKDSSGNVLEEIDVQTQTFSSAGTYTYAGGFVRNLMSNETLEVQFKKSAGTVSQFDTSATSSGIGTGAVVGYFAREAITSSELLNNERGKLKQWEFLKGIFTMFNLVAIQDKDNPKTLQIEPYNDIFLNPSNVGLTSVQHDWTHKVDISEIKLEPLKDLKRRTLFTYVKDKDDYALKTYNTAMGGDYLYGTKIYDASNLTILEGEKEIKASPFAPTIIKPVIQGFTTDMTVPAIYKCEDDECESFSNAPRILYDVTHTTTTYITGGQWSVPAQNGVSGVANHQTICQFAHLTTVPTVLDTTDYNFGECALINPVGSGGLPVNNLFNIYYAAYYEELYNPNTRIMKLKVYLTPSDINGFNFYDTVIIKNREYRVNKIDYKAGELAKVEFILI